MTAKSILLDRIYRRVLGEERDRVFRKPRGGILSSQENDWAHKDRASAPPPTTHPMKTGTDAKGAVGRCAAGARCCRLFPIMVS